MCVALRDSDTSVAGAALWAISAGGALCTVAVGRVVFSTGAQLAGPRLGTGASKSGVALGGVFFCAGAVPRAYCAAVHAVKSGAGLAVFTVVSNGSALALSIAVSGFKTALFELACSGKAVFVVFA